MYSVWLKLKMTNSRRQFFAAVKNSEFQGLGKCDLLITTNYYSIIELDMSTVFDGMIL